jgi:hypothetical protein
MLLQLKVKGLSDHDVLRIFKLSIVLLLVIPAGTSGAVDWIGQWKWEEQRDRITDRIVYLAHAKTLRTWIGGSSDINSASVLVYCSGRAAGIIFLWSRSAAGTKNLEVAFRFQGQPGHVTKARYVTRTKQETTDAADVRVFLDGLSKSNRLYVRTTSDLYGMSEADFRLGGSSEIVRLVRDACPALATTG